MKLDKTEKLLGIVLLALWIALFTLVSSSFAEVPVEDWAHREAWVVTKLHRDFGWVGNEERDALLREYNTLGEIAAHIHNELTTAADSKNEDRTKALVATYKRLETAIKDFIVRSETFIRAKRGI